MSTPDLRRHRFAGEVEVLRRAPATARLYGRQAVVPRSEYEGWLKATGTRFKTHDMYAAMREVARQARSGEFVGYNRTALSKQRLFAARVGERLGSA